MKQAIVSTSSSFTGANPSYSLGSEVSFCLRCMYRVCELVGENRVSGNGSVVGSSIIITYPLFKKKKSLLHIQCLSCLLY